MRLRRLAIPAVAAGVLVLGQALPAEANSARCTKDCAGYAYFVSHGEHLYVEDHAADGHSAVAVWYTPSTGHRYVWNPYGAFARTVDGNLSLPEGAGISYEVCLGEYSTRTVLWSTCSDAIVDRA